MRSCSIAAVVTALLTAILVPTAARAAPPAAAAAPDASPDGPDASPDLSAPTLVTVSGRLREAGGSRAPVGGATVLLVDAPANARPGKPAREPLDPEAMTWMVQAETDDEGRFTLAEVPVGKVRVVIVAGGYERLEQWAEVGPDGVTLDLFVDPDQDGVYRTEVAVQREQFNAPTHVIDAAQARHYAGGGDDPVLVALNLPGAARTPGGFGLLSLRGGNPTETGVYLDGHPIPRAFHIVPIASVLSPPLTDRVAVSPGNYGPQFGSFSAGLVEIYSRAGRVDGIHGESHLDLFDLGSTIEGPVGDGSVHVGARRSHVDGVLLGAEQVIGPTGILLPSYWDYLARFDYPVRPNHRISVRALGAGDRIRGRPFSGQTVNLFEFASSFHRFDLDYRLTQGDWSVLVSPSIRLDTAKIEQQALIRRDATVFSGRVEAANRVREWLTLEIGSDVVYERWRRRTRVAAEPGGDLLDDEQVSDDVSFEGQQLRLGVWLATKFMVRDWTLIPSLRLNVLSYSERQFVRPDPRLDIRGQVHPKLAVLARFGAYSIPVVLTNGGANAALISRNGEVFDGIADVPPYLIAFFDPGVDGEPRDGSSGATYAFHGSAGVEASLPWDLELRATLFGREVLSTSIPVYFDDGTTDTLESARRRAWGAELLVRRALGPKLDGWIGYTLMWARQQSLNGIEDPVWRPATFDQRHNLVVLLSATLPRNFRFGMRFRVVSGNPVSPVLAGESVSSSNSRFGFGLPTGNDYRPIRGEFGSDYQPVFHQLDLRIDKRWVRKRSTVSVYLDVQNVYNHVYAEVPVYTRDWSQRSSLIGLPIFPSLGVAVEY